MEKYGKWKEIKGGEDGEMRGNEGRTSRFHYEDKLEETKNSVVWE